MQSNHSDLGSGEDQESRQRIIHAAAKLVAAGGPEAATTRAVASAAGVQAPTIYRIFGDKRGLLTAVVQASLQSYLAEKLAHGHHPDPIQDLRNGWDTHIAFGLSHPGLIAIMSSEPESTWKAYTPDGKDVLRRRIQNIARAGRLRVTEERALGIVRAMGTGLVLTLLQQPEAERDLGLSEATREAMLAAITGESTTNPADGLRGTAVALRASLDQTKVLTKGEHQLLTELLDRIAG